MEKHVCMPAHLNVHHVCTYVSSTFDTVGIISFDPVFAFMNKLMIQKPCSHIKYHVIVRGVNI